MVFVSRIQQHGKKIVSSINSWKSDLHFHGIHSSGSMSLPDLTFRYLALKLCHGDSPSCDSEHQHRVEGHLAAVGKLQELTPYLSFRYKLENPTKSRDLMILSALLPQ